MNKIILLLLMLNVSVHGFSQMKGQVDKKVQRITINSGFNPKAEYKIFGTSIPTLQQKLMICFLPNL